MQRELWVDYIKVFACILVVLGHFFQSMTKANILPANDLYNWFNTTIYYFHVPLFFICSGYLYQKFSRVDSFTSWKKNVFKKFVVLGVPYFVFSTLIWGLKTVFSGAVNEQIGGIVDILLFHPTAPCWYLYCLFFIFIVTPTITGKKSAIAITTMAIIGKVLIIIGGGYGVYAVNRVLSNEIWFVTGMLICLAPKMIHKIKLRYGIVLIGIFTGLSVVSYAANISNELISFGLAYLACAGFLMAFIAGTRQECKILSFLASYTMPIFLMHTIFAAPVRALLMKMGMQSGAIHIAVGLGASFAGPIIAAEIMKRFKWMEFFLYPGKYIKFR